MKTIASIIVKVAFNLSTLIAVLLFIPLLITGFYEFVMSFYKFLNGHDAVGLLTDLLHSFEFFFLAPLPLMVVYSFRDYILTVFPLENGSKTAEIEKSAITPEVAERAFIGSLIGASSTFLLSKIIDLLQEACISDQKQLLLLSVLIIFILLQIFFYHTVSKHIKN
jgi:uncharacterized membrane protein YqhA